MNSIWQRRVWQAALKQYVPRDDAAHHLVLPIDRRVLLLFLMEAVEEVQALTDLHDIPHPQCLYFLCHGMLWLLLPRSER